MLFTKSQLKKLIRYPYKIPFITAKIIKARLYFRKYPPVFIIGSPRSGTTLLFKLLCIHPKYTSSFEPEWVWKDVFGKGIDDSYQNEFNSLGGYRIILNYFSKIEKQAPYLLTKNPKDSLRVNILHKMFPKARFVHIVRDGRDVISSIIDGWQSPHYVTDKKYNWNFLRIPNYENISRFDSHIKGAQIWFVSNMSIEKSIKFIRKPNYFLVRYEDLLEKPLFEVEKLTNFLEISLPSDKLNLILNNISNQVHKKNENEFAKNNIFGEKVIESEIDDDAGSGTLSKSKRIGKWKTKLSATELSEIMPIIKSYLEKYNYG